LWTGSIPDAHSRVVGLALAAGVICAVVSAENGGKLERRVVRAAEAALAERKFVTSIDVLVGLGWLEPRRVDECGRAGWTISSGW
jgi:hypothetical protein